MRARDARFVATFDDDFRSVERLIGRTAQRQAKPSTRAFQAARADTGEPPFVAESASMKRVMAIVDQFAAADATVLIQGESGTGKELVARACPDGCFRSWPNDSVACSTVRRASRRTWIGPSRARRAPGATASPPGASSPPTDGTDASP